MQSNQISNLLIRPALTGVGAYALTYVFVGNDGYVPFLSMELSPAFALGCTAAVGDLAGTAIHNQLVKKTPNQPDGFINAETMAIKPLLSGLSMMAVSAATMGGPGTTQGAIKMLALGSLSSVSGKYAGDLVIPMVKY